MLPPSSTGFLKQQNSINPTSYNLELLIIQHLRRSFIIETGRSQGHVQKRLQECLYVNHCGISGPLAPLPSLTPENTKKYPEPADIQWNTS
jgi:hypothetical protein